MWGIRLPNWLGDVLLARRALQRLVDQHEQDELAIATRAPFIELLQTEFPRATWIPTEHGVESALALGARWKKCGVDTVWLFPTSLSSRLAGRVSGARRRIGFAPRPGRVKEQGAAWFLTQKVARREIGHRHLEDEYLDLVGMTPSDPIRRAPLAVAGDAAGRASESLEPLAGDPYLVIAPGARYGPAKRWPVSRFAEAAITITRRLNGARVVVVGEADDQQAGDELTELLGPVALSLVGMTDLPTLSGILASSAGVLSNDSGTAHLSAAVGATTVVLFGSTDPAWTAPRGERVAVLHKKVRCSPCFRRRCPLTDAYACLRVLEARTVIDSFTALRGREAA